MLLLLWWLVLRRRLLRRRRMLLWLLDLLNGEDARETLLIQNYGLPSERGVL